MDNKKVATKFLELVIQGNIDEAYSRFVTPEGKHHNAFFAAGFPALQTAMKENHGKFPDKQLVVKHVLADGDLVAVHSQLIPKPGDTGMVTMHIFRIVDGKIVELWDFGQEIPVDLPNTDGVF